MKLEKGRREVEKGSVKEKQAREKEFSPYECNLLTKESVKVWKR